MLFTFWSILIVSSFLSLCGEKCIKQASAFRRFSQTYMFDVLDQIINFFRRHTPKHHSEGPTAARLLTCPSHLTWNRVWGVGSTLSQSWTSPRQSFITFQAQAKAVLFNGSSSETSQWCCHLTPSAILVSLGLGVCRLCPRILTKSKLKP